jgi:hypothetical protein
VRGAVRLILSALAIACSASALQARPVTYPGGKMSMTEVMGDTVLTQLDYTISRRVAIGAYGLRESGGERLSAGAVVNYLLMRRNTEVSQANAYLAVGAGPSWERQPGRRGRDTDPSGWVAAEADWETRRLFVGGMGQVSVSNDGDVETGFRTRLGVAPYVADAGALHTWLFLQVGRAAQDGEDVQVTPVLRLFRGDVLGEAGVSLNGQAFATLWFYF